MIKLMRYALGLTLLSLGFAATAATNDTGFDAVIMLDNTLSMRSSDPHGLVKKAVADFIHRAGPMAKIELIQYDESVEVLVPLRESVSTAPLTVFKKMNYRGRFANLPSALERASYDLKAYGRSQVPKAIILFTDSGIDTGDAQRDQVSMRWVREEFAQDAARHHIQVFALTLSEKADHQLLHTLATVTHGDYARAERDQDLSGAVDKLREQIGLIPERSRMAKDNLPRRNEQGSATKHSGVTATGRFLSSPAGLTGLFILAGAAAFAVSKRTVEPEPEVAGNDMMVADASFDMKPMPAAELRRTEPFHAHEDYRLMRPFTVVGRIAPLPNTKVGHLHLDSQSIGRCHALIEYRQGTFWVIDKKSRNGTYVNDERIEGERRLHHQDRVRFHFVEFEFWLPGFDADDTLVAHRLPLESNNIKIPNLAASDNLEPGPADNESAIGSTKVDTKAEPKGRASSGLKGVPLGSDFILDDEQSINKLLSQLNAGPIVDPQGIDIEVSDTFEVQDLTGDAIRDAENHELDAMIRDYIGPTPMETTRDSTTQTTSHASPPPS